jgi:hypothetical protein
LADDDNLQQQAFQSTDTGAAIASAAAAALAALASGVVLRAQEILALADDAGEFRHDVDSTCVAALTYNVHTGYLLVELTDGSDWPYQNVSMFNFLRWMNAGSYGSFYNSEVRGRWG